MKSRWLTSTVLGIGAASLFSDLSHETVTSLLPALLASMGVAAGALGTIEGVADGVSSVAKLYGGWLTDRIRRRKPLCAGGYAAMALATGVIASATAWPIVMIGRALAWFSRGIRTPPRKTLLADAVTPETYGRAFGFERMMDTTGAVAAPLAAMALLRWGVPQRQVLWLSLIPAIAAAAAIIFLVRESTTHVPRQRPFIGSLRALPQNFGQVLKAVGLFGAGDFAHSLMILYAVVALTPQFGTARASVTATGFYALHNVVYAAVSYPAGSLADRMNKYSLLGFGYFCGALTALLLALQVRQPVLLAGVFVLGGFYVGIEETLEDSLTAALVARDLRGTGFGTLAVVNGIGDSISSLAVGWLWTAFSPAAGFGFAFVLMAAGAGFILRMRYGNSGSDG
jgi:MFS family permease